MYVYADNAATTRVSEKAAKAIEECFLEIYGNPSSTHKKGKAAKLVLDGARKTIGECINSDADKIYFTSGGTESDSWAIKIAEEIGLKRGKNHIISTAIEHHAVGNSLKALEKKGFEITYLKPQKNGIISVSDFEKAIKPETFFVSIMYANNVIGTLQPIKEIGMICRKRAIIFHTDAVQAIGHIPIDVESNFIDILSASAHKFHGPKGAGFLYCRDENIMTVFIEGGGQEKGYRSGTENIPGIAGMAEALKERTENMNKEINHITFLKEIIEKAVSEIEDAKINGDIKKRLPGNINISFKGVSGESLLRMLDMEGICASASSACSAGKNKPNFVLMAMGHTNEEASSSLRLSLSHLNTKKEAEYIGETLKTIVSNIRQISMAK